jgi:hypothetical protein
VTTATLPWRLIASEEAAIRIRIGIP